MAGRRSPRWPAVAVVASACAAPASAPWWPAPAVAEPSPALALVGLAPPLTGPDCHRVGPPPWRFTSWRGTAAYLVHGPTIACVVPVAADPVSGAPRHASVLAGARGRVFGVDWSGPVQSAAAAARAADSTLVRGLQARGATACASVPQRTDTRGVPWPAVRGWRTPAYEALVWVDPAPDPSVREYALRVAVSGGGSVLCRRAGSRPADA